MAKKIVSKRPAKAIPKTIKPRTKAIAAKTAVTPWVPTSRLLSRPEGLNVDFKRSADAVGQEDMVAFANAGGGTILVGVDETTGSNGIQKGKVVGFVVSDRERNKIVSRANSCRPAIHVTIFVESERNKSFMRIEIPKGGLHCTSSGTYKIRRDGQTDVIDPSAMAKIIVELERKKIMHYLREAIQPEIAEIQSDLDSRVDEALAEIDDLRSSLDDFDSRDEHYDRD